MMLKKTLMLVTVVMLAAAALVWTGASTAQAAPPRQDSPDMRTVTVTGFGAAYGAPDIVMVGLGVEASNTDIKAAMDDTTARMNQILATLVDNGIAREDIRTEHFSIYQDYSGPMDAQAPRTYRVSTSVVITVREVDRVGELLAAAVDAGANMVNYIQFDIEDRTALQDEARVEAVENARARAENLAGLLGLSVGEPLNVIENSDMYGPMMMGGGGGGLGSAGAAPISEGQLSVNMSVTITFALVPAS